MHSHTVSKPPLSVCECACVCGCLRANAAAFPSGSQNVPTNLMPGHCLCAAAAASLTVLSNTFLCLQTPSTVYVGTEEDVEQVLNYFTWESLERRNGRWCEKKRMIWFPNSKRDEKHSQNTDSMYQTWREGRELKKQQMKDQK